MHTGSHKLNNALGQCAAGQAHGQAAHHRRDRRRPARRRDRDRVRAARAGVRRLHGHRGHAPPGAQRAADAAARARRSSGVDAGSRTLKEAVSAAIRDWVANVGDTHYAIGSCVGPAPFPALVRDLQRVIGDEARAQVLERCGRLPARVIACVGGGSNAIGIFVPFVDDAGVELVGVEAAGDGLDERPPRRAADGRRAGPRRRAARRRSRRSCRTRRARSPRRTRSPPASTIPASGPEHAWLRDSGRARYEAVTDAQALAAFRRMAELEGIIPALESSHAVAWVLANAPVRRGRARADLPLGPRRQGPRRGAGARGVTRRHRAGHDRRGVRGVGRPRCADAVPDGRLPRSRHVARDRRGLRRARRRPRRAGRAVLRPARRRPGDPRRRDRRAGGGRDGPRRARARARARGRASRWC